MRRRIGFGILAVLNAGVEGLPSQCASVAVVETGRIMVFGTSNEAWCAGSQAS